MRILARTEVAVGVLLLAIITGLVFAAAVMRYFGKPLIWSVDLAQLLFIWICFLGATKALRERAHLGVDLVVRYLPHRWRLAIEIGLALVTLVFLAILAVEGWQLMLLNRERQFGDSGLSYAFVTGAVPVGCVLLALAILVNLADAWRRRGEGRRLVFARTADEG